jgi:hypothetical protein
MRISADAAQLQFSTIRAAQKSRIVIISERQVRRLGNRRRQASKIVQITDRRHPHLEHATRSTASLPTKSPNMIAPSRGIVCPAGR